MDSLEAAPSENLADLGDSVILQNPQGELETVSKAEATQSLLPYEQGGGGYTQADPAAIQHADLMAKHGTLGQQAIGFGEQALSAFSLHGSDVLATKLGLTTPEAQEARKEGLGTGLGMAAQGLGLGMSLLVPGEGALGVLGKVGDAALDLAGLSEATGTAAKIGSAAVKAAAENATYQATEEGAKVLQGNPDQDFGSAVANIGLAAAIGAPFGAALGSINPLWEATSGTKLAKSLKAITDKFGGVESPAMNATMEVADRAGVPLSAEAKSVISKDPFLQGLAQPLQDSQGSAGEAFQGAIKQTRSNLANAVLESVGKTSEDMESLADFSTNKAGTEVQSKLGDEIKKFYEPIKKDYEEISNKYSQAEFNQGDRAVLAENLVKLSSDEGWSVRPSSPEAGFLNRALKDISVIDNLDKLRTFGDSLSKEAVSMNRFDISRGLGKIFDSAEEAFVKLRLGNEAPELLGKHEAVTAQYREIKSMINELNGRLHAGSSKGVGTFLYKLQDMVPEQVLNRLAQTKDASFIEFLNKHFPEVQKSVNDFQLNKVLKASMTKMGSEEVIDPTKFFKQVQKLSPELRNSIISSEGQQRLGAIAELWDGLHSVPKNYSNTAATLDKMMRYMPASATAALSMLTGHNPLMGAAIGHMAELLGRDAPDAVRLGLIKFLGSSSDMSPQGLKTAVDFIQHTIKGENILTKATKSVFKSGQIVLPQSALPSEKDRKKLDTILKSYQKNPEAMLKIGGALGHYLPDHATAQGKATANAVQILNSMRPTSIKNSPLDKEIEPSKAQKAEFDRVLDVAEKPLVVLQHIKEGTLQPKDVQILATVHPDLYQNMIQKLTNDMTDHLSKDGDIPYKTRMGLSLLAGQPLDSTLTPQSIQEMQQVFLSPQMKPSEVQGKVAINSFKHLAENEKTPNQRLMSK